ncbi:MAG: ABC transporter permease subunit [Clostridium sp.]|nr:ABC transporter permease subunit [Clostridium sp.]
MEMFKVAFLNEVEKIYKRKKVIVAIIISLFVIVAGQLMVTMVNMGFGLRAVSATQFPLLVLSLFSNTILPFFTTLVVIDVFSSEFSHNTMKLSLARPVSRLKLYAAKACAVAIFILFNLLVVMVLSLLASIIFNANSFSLGGIWRVVLSYLVTVLPVMSFALIIVFMANIFKSGTAVFFITIILFIAFNGLSVVFPRYSNLFITSLFGWHSLWNVNTVQVSKIIREFLIISGCGIMSFTAGYYLFVKRDL